MNITEKAKNAMNNGKVLTRYFLDAALEAKENYGLPVLPIKRGSKAPAVLSYEQWFTEPQSIEQVQAMPFGVHTVGGFAVILPERAMNPDGKTVLDIDNGSYKTMQAIQQGLNMPEGYKYITESGSGNGMHIWVSVQGLPDGELKPIKRKLIGDAVNEKPPALEVYFQKRYMIMPPSKHPGGGVYRAPNGVAGKNDEMLRITYEQLQDLISLFCLPEEKPERAEQTIITPRPLMYAPGESLFDKVHYVLRGELRKDGEHHADCPYCSKPAKENQNHFTYGDKGGFNCFVCGESGSIADLAKHLGIVLGGSPNIISRASVQQPDSEPPDFDAIPNPYIKEGTEGEQQPEDLGVPAVAMGETLNYLGLNTIRAAAKRGDMGLAELFTSLYKGRIVYDNAYKADGWHIWQWNHWRQLAGNSSEILGICSYALNAQFLAAAHEIHEQIQVLMPSGGTDIFEQSEEQKAAAEQLEKLQKEYRLLNKKALAVLNVGSLKKAVELANSHLRFTGTWDYVPELLPVKNGVLNLRTGSLEIGNPEHHCRKHTPIEFKGLNEPCPRFEQFINEIFKGLNGVPSFMNRLLGYGISGTVKEHILPVLYGSQGRNGKDTLLETLGYVMGNELASSASQELLIVNRGLNGGQASPHLMDLQGKRLTWVSETEEGGRLNAAQVKLITGGGQINARPLYGRHISFEQTHLLMLITNHKPIIPNGGDNALWARLILVPFEQRFVDNPTAPNEHKKDGELKDKLKAEASGILAWLVKGYQAYIKEGLNVPGVVKSATDNYQASEDVFSQFIDECCYVAESAKGESFKPLWDAFIDFGGGMNRTAFKKRLVERFGEHHRTASQRLYKGLELLAHRNNDGEPPIYEGVNF